MSYIKQRRQRQQLRAALIKFRDAAYHHGWTKGKKDYSPLDSSVDWDIDQAFKRVQAADEKVMVVVDEIFEEIETEVE